MADSSPAERHLSDVQESEEQQEQRQRVSAATESDPQLRRVGDAIVPRLLEQPSVDGEELVRRFTTTALARLDLLEELIDWCAQQIADLQQ